MNKKDKKELGYLISFGTLILLIWITNSMNLPWNAAYTFIGIFIFSIVFGHLVISLLPDKKAKNNNPIKNTKNQKQSKASNRVPPGRRLPIEKLIHMELDKINGHEFEELCRAYIASKYKYVEKTPDQKDGGVDIIFVDEEGFRVAVQCKHYINSGKKVTLKEINELEGAKRSRKCIRTLFICTTIFTDSARETANKYKMDLWDYSDVKNKIIRWKEAQGKKFKQLKIHKL
jgi:restriction system protein